jgi:hypothetical protein
LGRMRFTWSLIIFTSNILLQHLFRWLQARKSTIIWLFRAPRSLTREISFSW